MKVPNHSNIVEMLGRNHLIAQLIVEGVHVALPLWDQGVDLVAYYRGQDGFVARPLQLKVAEATRWGLDVKYADIVGLLLVYIWNVRSAPEDVEIYAMSYREAEHILNAGGDKDYSQSNTWKNEGRYSIAHLDKPKNKLRKNLQPFRMQHGLWKDRLGS
ncbi:MAG: hypothetical protein ABI147_00215 [Acidobacteriaceae bacterium]